MLISYKKPKGRFFIVGKPGGSPAVMRHISINVSGGLGTLYIDGNAVTLDADNTWEADIADGTQITMQMSVDSDHEMCCWNDLNGNIPEWQDDYGTHYGSTATITVSGDYAIGTQIDTYYNLTVVVDPTKYTLKVNDTVYSTDYHGRSLGGNCEQLACIPETGYQFNGWGTTTVDAGGWWCYSFDEVITPDVTAVAPVQPNDEIWYTSTDGNVVTPKSADFGTGITVASNTYADGKGVIKLSGNATTIGVQAFYSTKLRTIDIPNSVTTFATLAFARCTGLTSFAIPSSVTSIGQSTFDGCSGLTSVTIPESVTSIGYRAFYTCTHLTSVTCEATTPPTLGNYVFDGTNNCPIYVPAESVTAYQEARGWSAYSSRIQAIP